MGKTLSPSLARDVEASGRPSMDGNVWTTVVRAVQQSTRQLSIRASTVELLECPNATSPIDPAANKQPLNWLHVCKSFPAFCSVITTSEMYLQGSARLHGQGGGKRRTCTGSCAPVRLHLYSVTPTIARSLALQPQSWITNEPCVPASSGSEAMPWAMHLFLKLPDIQGLTRDPHC